jgi:hypothetical protein
MEFRVEVKHKAEKKVVKPLGIAGQFSVTGCKLGSGARPLYL